MALIIRTILDGDIDLVDLSIMRLREFEPAEGYYGAFSGGKDSLTLKELCRMAGVKVDWHYNWTTVDPPELLAYIKKYHPDVEIHKPEMSMWQLIPKKRMAPTRLVRYCCAYLKEQGGDGRRVLTGIRWAESNARSKRNMFEAKRTDKSGATHFLHPIIDWTDSDVWEFIHLYKLPYCSLYDEGFKRIVDV
jgi:phosphoadenosine phosphosulfate reductase